MAISVDTNSGFAAKALNPHLLCQTLDKKNETVTLFLDKVGKVFQHEESGKLKVNFYCTIESDHSGPLRKLDDAGQFVTEVDEITEEKRVVIDLSENPYRGLDVSFPIKLSNRNYKLEEIEDDNFEIELFKAGRFAQLVFGYLKATDEIDDINKINKLKCSYSDLIALEGAKAVFKPLKKKFKRVYYELVSVEV